MRAHKMKWMITFAVLVLTFANVKANINIESGTDPGSHPGLHLYDVKFYWIDVEATDTSTFLTGNTQIQIQLLNDDVDTIIFELINEMMVDSIMVDGKKQEFIHDNDLIHILLASPFNKNDLKIFKIFYHGFGGTSSGFFSGISSSFVSKYSTNVTWTLSEPLKAKQWFPCKQVLDDKADSAYIYITVDDGLRAGSNGTLTSITDMYGNKKRYEWKTHYTIAYYLLSLAVAEYAEYDIYAKPEGCEDSILIQNYIYKGYLEGNKEEIDEARDILEYLSKVYGIYPFAKEKYGHCLAPMGGGMEHQTMTTLSNTDFLLIAHEMSHQWFGDYITCAKWNDIWVNEGFASYSEYIALQGMRTQAQANDWMRKAHTMAKSSNRGPIYVPDNSLDDEYRIFDYALTYKKGAAIIHMIRYELNDDELFFTFLRTILTRFANNVATGEDVKGLLEELSGKDFTDFFNQWYYASGYPIYDIIWEFANDTLIINIKQEPSNSSVDLFKHHFDVKMVFEEGDSAIRLYQDRVSQTFYVPMDKRVESVSYDPEEWLLRDVRTIFNARDTIFDASKIHISPNPFKKELVIIYDNPVTSGLKLTIRDASGRAIFTEYSTHPEFYINTQNFKSGVYILEVVDGKKKFIQKIIRK